MLCKTCRPNSGPSNPIAPGALTHFNRGTHIHRGRAFIQMEAPRRAIEPHKGDSMQATLVSFVLAGVLLVPGMPTAPKPQAPFSIVIGPLRQSIAAGTEVKVEITLTNISNREIYLSKANATSQAEFHFVVEAYDDTGKPAPDTE